MSSKYQYLVSPADADYYSVDSKQVAVNDAKRLAKETRRNVLIDVIDLEDGDIVECMAMTVTPSGKVLDS
jgi:hypothetical protein